MLNYDKAESNHNAAASVALVGKKFPKPVGGCAAIFFQLVDWNRRLGKKKLFSKKLLSPVRFKQGRNKFGDRENHQKLRLDHEMRVPGLVARLMGLDSIPATPTTSSIESMSVEKRPQKLHKANAGDRQQVSTRIRRPEKLPLINTLSKQRKHHPHPKLPLPLKYPRNHSRKRSSKLLDAATKILEPRLKLHGNQQYNGPLPQNNPFCGQNEQDYASLQPKKPPIVLPKLLNTGNGALAPANLKGLSSVRMSMAAAAMTRSDCLLPVYNGLSSISASQLFQRNKFELEKRILTRGRVTLPLGQKRSCALTTDSMSKQGAKLPKDINNSYSCWKSTPWDNSYQKNCTRIMHLSEAEWSALFEQKSKGLNYRGDDLDVNGSDNKMTATLQEIQSSALHIPLQQDIRSYISTASCSNSHQFTEVMDYWTQSSIPDSELLDSTASKAKSSRELVINVMKNVSEILCHNALAKCDEANISLLNAELVFQTAALSSSIVGRGSPIKHLLIDELETLATFLCIKFVSTIRNDNGKGMDKHKRFAFEAILEHLNSRFDTQTTDRLKLLKHLQIRMSTDMLMFEVIEAVGRWSEGSQFSLNKLISKEMSSPLREWTEYEKETYDCGLNVCNDLLRNLVNEIVTDLCDSYSLSSV